MAPSLLSELLARIDTDRLRQGNTPTVALVVMNHDETRSAGLARFHASFPVRAEVGARPVTIKCHEGDVIPSRLTESVIEERPELPPGRVQWTLILEFLVEGVPPHGWRAYGASFGASPLSHSDRSELWGEWDNGTEHAVLAVYETDCHAGDLPLCGTYDIMQPQAAGREPAG
jgi:hypothetical protein